MRRAFALTMALAGCAPVAVPPAANPPPQGNPIQRPAIPLPLRLVGTEPFWGVLLKDGSLSFSGVDRGSIVAAIAETTVRSGGIVVFKTAPPSTHMPVVVQATIMPMTCSDGMSDRTYPYAATVDIDYAGASPPVTLKGCAGPESLLERSPS